jgi:hypothetical protein
MNALALAALHLDLLYECDAGLIARCRNFDGPTPLVHLVRTADGNRWLLSSAIPPRRRAEVHATLEALPAGFEDPGHRSLTLEPVLHSLGREGQPPAVARGPAFTFPGSLPKPKRAEILLDPQATSVVSELAWVREVQPHEHPLAVSRNERGEVVAVCHSSRSTPDGAEAGVETASEYRGRGLACEVVLAWATAVRVEGRLPLYSTDWSNLASRAVATKLGLAMYGEDCRVIA